MKLPANRRPRPGACCPGVITNVQEDPGVGCGSGVLSCRMVTSWPIPVIFPERAVSPPGSASTVKPTVAAPEPVDVLSLIHEESDASAQVQFTELRGSGGSTRMVPLPLEIWNVEEAGRSTASADVQAGNAGWEIFSVVDPSCRVNSRGSGGGIRGGGHVDGSGPGSRRR